MTSKALDVNIETSRVSVEISDEFKLIQEVLSKYSGIMDNLNTFLTELCHPYKNWEFIVREARTYSLDYFHLLKSHPKGIDAARIFINIFLEVIEGSTNSETERDGADYLLIYLQKIIKDSGDGLSRFIPVLEYAFDRIGDLDPESFSLFIKSYYQINKIANDFFYKTDSGEGFESVNSIVIKYLDESYRYWMKEQDPFLWFTNEINYAPSYSKELDEIFKPISHNRLRLFQKELASAIHNNGKKNRELLEKIIKLPGYRQIGESYRDIPRLLYKTGEKSGQGNYWKLIFLFHIMNIAGLSLTHEETLREINRTLTWLIGNEKPKELEPLIKKTFDILAQSVYLYPGTALNCVRNMGKAVYKTDESDLVDFFLESVMDLGFQTPDFKGMGEDLQARVNSAHIQNIRAWLDIIELNPTWSKKLMSSLIIYLSLCGVYIKDTDLFPRDITRFLNSDISNVYNLTKQLTRLFPAYFNDIGAEGHLRDISTRLDEICFRKDALIHFLRKQSHVESSNRIIGLMEATLDFWRYKNKESLSEYLPRNIFEQIEVEGPYIDGVHKLLSRLFEKEKIDEVNGLLVLDEEKIKEALKDSSGTNNIDRERVELAISFYKLLFHKYSIDFPELDNYIYQLQPGTFPAINKLRDTLSKTDVPKKISELLSYLEMLKELILSSEKFDIREDIYHKRHFTIDIPSMYGSYHERKFDSMGLTFRLESLVNSLFDELVSEMDLRLITRDTFFQIKECLILFHRALKLDGLLSSEIEKQLDLLGRSLEVSGFSFTQFIDIFRGFSQAVSNVVNDYFNAMHQQNLIKILDKLSDGELLPKYRGNGEQFGKDKTVHRVSEVFLRERIAFALGLQQLDLFLTRIMNTLFQQSDRLPKEELRLLLNYDPKKAVSFIGTENNLGLGVIHLGNKGLNLVRLKKYGFSVPPGFIITTEIFRYREVIRNYPPADKNYRDQIKREIKAIEEYTGKIFGNPKDPLLLSVRSGAPISQPGMMDTFLDVGINEDIVQGIIDRTGEKWFAWDCYRRFLQSYGMAFGLNRNDFDDIIADSKTKLGVPHKINLTGEEMKQVTMDYKDYILGKGIDIETSPLEQLYITIGKVFESWNTTKAKKYRKIMKISDDWGTAVTVQAMVFGNLGKDTGSGVVFTHSPRLPGDMVRLWGDYTLANQGEDVVSGLVNTLPISNSQAEYENRDINTTLQNSFPQIYDTIRSLAKELVYDRNWSPQEMEFTFESSNKEDLYFLQTRDMAIRESKKVMSFVTGPDSESRFLGHGIGVSGGAMTGRAVFNLNEIRTLREKDPDTPLILIRGDTVPDDIEEIFESDGLLTARGGSTSHAAIVAYRLGKTCVVGSPNLICMEKESSCSLDQIYLNSGDWISIDGREGSIYSGIMEIEEVARG